MLSTSRIRLVVFMVVLSHVAYNSYSYSSGSQIRCNWNCSVHTADLTELTREMETSMATNELIKLGVQYEKTVDDKCANETSVHSSEYASEYCQVCLVNKRPSQSTTVIKRLINNVFYNVDQREIRAICSLNPARTSVSSPTNYSSRSSTICHLINLEAEFDRIGYQAVEKDDLRSCINVTISNGTNSAKGALEQRAWPSTLLAVLNVFALSFSEEHLPYVACSVFVLYYIWSSYSYFTKTYHELALALFYYNKNSRQNQVNYVPHNSNQLQKLPSTADNDLENIMAIPKRLFDMACEELRPLREGVCKLILKIILIVSSVLIVFTLTILSTSETTPLMKTLLTFLTLSSPKIVAIYVDGGWQEKLRAMVVEEKVPKIVEKFLSETSETNHGQRCGNIKTDEVILVTEDYIELASM
ncbi:hypothetical protein pdam_00019739 [Pocillopora damicornis]|uniref:Uncharacterized protein n=1 Tax=Pocillopora damicornis TaxID=46731 RepID=A0A3M6TVT6_POCDA|nr:hypothetical protein pdam_00019739 [Pocillopora damicornis]